MNNQFTVLIIEDEKNISNFINANLNACKLWVHQLRHFPAQ